MGRRRGKTVRREVKQREAVRSELPEYGKQEGGGEVENCAKSFNPKGVGENSGRTNRIRHKGKGFGRSDYRRREDE